MDSPYVSLSTRMSPIARMEISTWHTAAGSFDLLIEILNRQASQAAEMEGIGQPYLSKLESGGIGSSVNHLLRLLRLLRCEIVVRKRGESG